MFTVRKALSNLSNHIAAITHVRLGWLGLTTLILLLLIFYLLPSQFPIVLHKVSLVTLGSIVGFWIDAHLFPFATPWTLKDGDQRTFQVAMLRRALIVSAVLLAIATGL